MAFPGNSLTIIAWMFAIIKIRSVINILLGENIFFQVLFSVFMPVILCICIQIKMMLN